MYIKIKFFFQFQKNYFKKENTNFFPKFRFNYKSRYIRHNSSLYLENKKTKLKVDKKAIKMAKIFDESYVTLATNENYAIGALTLGYSLRKVNTNRMLTIMISKEVSQELRSQLNEVFDKIEVVDVLNSNDLANLSLLKRPELGVTFTKLHCWRLTQFQKAIFLDADCLVLKNVDELFEREEFSASTDVGWPDCFNSGVFVYRPSDTTYSNLVNFAMQQGSFDGD